MVSILVALVIVAIAVLDICCIGAKSKREREQK